MATASTAVEVGSPPAEPLEVRWLGRVPYREAWALQHRLREDRVREQIPDQLLLLEHPAVLTLGRGADPSHVRASPAALEALGIEVIRVERGGEVTYHGPGQLVAYPILAVSRRGLLIRPLVHALEAAMIDTCASFGVVAGRREGHPGSWVAPERPEPRKIGALGLRIERGVSYHGIALNIAPNLAHFDLIDPCGMQGLVSTSIAVEAGWDAAALVPEAVAAEVARAGARFADAFAAGLAAGRARQPASSG